MDRLLLVVAITVLAGSLQGYALRLAGLRRQVDPHWKRGMSVLRIGLAALQMYRAARGFALAQGDEQQIGAAGLVPEHAFAMATGGAAVVESGEGRFFWQGMGKGQRHDQQLH